MNGNKRQTTEDIVMAKMEGAALPSDEALTDMYGEVIEENPFAVSDDTAADSTEVAELRAALTEARQQLARYEGMPLEHSLIPVGEDVREMGGFKFLPRALIVPQGLKGKDRLDRLNLVLHFLMDLQAGLQFWWGDLGNDYESENVDIDELADFVHVERATFKGWMRVCKKIPPAMRIARLEFSHYFELARMPLKLKGREIEMLEKCQILALSSREFKQFLIDTARGAKVKKLAKPRPADTLFSKESRPVLGDMRNAYMATRRGVDGAKEQLVDQISRQRAWLDEIERAAGLK